MARIEAWHRHDPQACLQDVAAVVEPRVAQRRPRPWHDVVLTTSTDPHDLNARSQAGANRDAHKPMDCDGLMPPLQRRKDVWCEVVIGPKGGHAR